DDEKEASTIDKFHQSLQSITQETVDETQVMFTQIMDKLISESDGNSPQSKDEKTRLTRFKKDILAEKFSIESLSFYKK
ncbi:hypothetical protein, partial [Aliivibrio fischeri]|uniref:hypothetical protein n=1 Tax=Aliivibrio fischeri TaxID=668 RepID=UPI0035557066